MSTVIFKPHAGAQTEYMSFDGRYALYGGAAGPGKTSCLIYYPFRQMLVEDERISRGEIRQSVGRSIIFRRTMPELREIIDRCARDFPRLPNKPDWHEQTKTWTFPNGYKYMFGQMEDPDDWIKYYSFEFTCVCFDEATTFTEEQVNQLDTRLRTTDPVLKDVLWLRLATNPVGPGVEWIKRRYVDVAPPRTLVIRQIKVPTIDPDGTLRVAIAEREQIYIPGRVTDNPSLDYVEYAATLSSHSNEVKRQLLEGDWTVVQGAWVGELWEPSVHVIKKFKIPNGWFRFRSCDYGYSSKASVGWWCVDFDGNLTCYRSLTCTKQTAEQLANLIREIEIENREWNHEKKCSLLTGPLDSATWARTGVSAPSIAETMNSFGLNWVESDKSQGRHHAANQMRQRLMRRCGHPTVKDKDGKPALIVPGIRFMEGVAVRSPRRYTFDGPIKSIPVLPADKDDPDVPNTNADDHDWDMVAYACAYRPLVPEKKDYVKDPLDPDYIDDLEAERLRRSQTGRLGMKGMWRSILRAIRRLLIPGWRIA